MKSWAQSLCTDLVVVDTFLFPSIASGLEAMARGKTPEAKWDGSGPTPADSDKYGADLGFRAYLAHVTGDKQRQIDTCVHAPRIPTSATHPGTVNDRSGPLTLSSLRA